ncbi:MAG TPA: MMPL family transporter [Candidatus Thermoplasmatota archaeon]|nr:MMPL family transporter [Candidatus Thermoplasmatota archaeon]
MAPSLLGEAVGAVTAFSARHAKAVLAVVLVATLVFAAGLPNIELRSADYDLMPTWHPSYQANAVALERVPGFRSIESVYFETQPGKRVNQEDSIRALEEANQRIQRCTNDRSHAKVISYEYSLPFLIKLVNYAASTNPATGERDAQAFRLPDSTRLNAYYAGLYQASRPAIEGIVNENFTATLLVFMYDLETTRAGPEKVLPASGAFLACVQEYRGWLKAGNSTLGAHNALNPDHVYVLGELINAHSTDLATQDFQQFLPIVALVILGCLMIAFRKPSVVLITFITLGVAIAWTYGLMGHLRLPLDFFSMLIVPISLGAGVDYAIHVANEYTALRGDGLPHPDAVRGTGRRVGAALVITALTTIAGFVIMTFSEFPPMVNLGLLGTILFVTVLTLALTLIPALLTLTQARRKGLKPAVYREAFVTRHTARFVGRYKAFVLLLVVVGTVVLGVSATQVEPYFDISGGFREGDYVRTSYEYYNTHWGGAGTELLTVIPPGQNGVADPSTMRYLAALDNEFKHNLTSVIPHPSNVNSLRIAIDTYETLKDGGPSIVTTLLAKGNNPDAFVIPPTKEGVLGDIRAMYADPVFASLAALFVDPDATVAVNHIFYEIHGGTFGDLERAWTQMNQGIKRAQSEAQPLPGTKTDLVGTQDTFYLYVKYGYPWIGYVAVLSTLAVVVLAAIFMRDARSVVVVLLPMVLTSIWWLGILPLFGIQASLTLMLPIVFISCVGSDFAVQYAWAMKHERDPDRVFGTVGKGIFWSAVTTILAFAVFAQGDLILAAQSALATALAIIMIYIVTMLVVPPFYHKGWLGGKRAPPRKAREVVLGEAPRAAVRRLPRSP